MTIKVKWYCGLYYFVEGDYLHDEGQECEAEFFTEEDLDDWHLGICETTCLKCGGMLHQGDDHAELVGL